MHKRLPHHYLKLSEMVQEMIKVQLKTYGKNVANPYRPVADLLLNQWIFLVWTVLGLDCHCVYTILLPDWQ